MIAYYDFIGDKQRSQNFQKRLHLLLSLKNVDDQLERQLFVKKLAANSQFTQPIGQELYSMAQINQTIQKTTLESDIKDHLISRELRFQKTSIENK